MNTLSQMNQALCYIEENLIGEINYGDIFRIAGCSEYHFRRMFPFLVGMTLGEYIRRRRLTVAAMELKNHDIKVIDLALKLGYDSPDAFGKAFQSMHGVTPSQARKSEVLIKAFLPVTLQLTVRGGNEMNFRIVEKEAFKVIGFKERVTMVFEGVNPQMNPIVQKLTPEIIIELKGLCNVEPNGILSVSANFEERTVEGTELDQYIGVATTIDETAANVVNSKYDTLSVEASTWAIFEAIGIFPKALQEIWGKIYSEWFPSSGYELTGGPEILWNESPDTSKADYRSEIWIPVRTINN